MTENMWIKPVTVDPTANPVFLSVEPFLPVLTYYCCGLPGSQLYKDSATLCRLLQTEKELTLKGQPHGGWRHYGFSSSDPRDNS